jgi:hypothetical protein
MRKAVKADLKILLEHFGRHYSVNPSPYRAASVIVGLFGALVAGDNGCCPDDIQIEVRKIEDALPLLHTLEALTDHLDSNHHIVSWHPDLRRDQLLDDFALSPTFNFPERDSTATINAVTVIAERIQELHIGYSRVISWIFTTAKSQGYLEDGPDEGAE